MSFDLLHPPSTNDNHVCQVLLQPPTFNERHTSCGEHDLNNKRISLLLTFLNELVLASIITFYTSLLMLHKVQLACFLFNFNIFHSFIHSLCSTLFSSFIIKKDSKGEKLKSIQFFFKKLNFYFFFCLVVSLVLL